MKWLNAETFWKRYEERYKHTNTFIEHSIVIDIDHEEMSRLIPYEAEDQWVDGLGDAKVWYVDSKQSMFVLESLTYTGQGTTVILPIDQNTTDDWSFIKALEALPDYFRQRISWVHSTSDGNYSLFCNHDTIVYPLFGNTDQKNAEALKSYLLSHSCALDLCVAEVERFNAGWSGRTKTEHICHYTSRSSAERVINEYQCSHPNELTRINCNEGMPNHFWKLYRQDDNSNRFHMMNYQFQVDALFAAMKYESLGHHQVYWVEKQVNQRMLPLQSDRPNLWVRSAKP